jgi:hypothetical protein
LHLLAFQVLKKRIDDDVVLRYSAFLCDLGYALDQVTAIPFCGDVEGDRLALASAAP